MTLFSFIGWSGSGKTTLITKLIKELVGRGLKIAALKHVPEKFHLEPEGKDSRRFLENGASESFLLGSGQIVNSMLINRDFDFFKTFEERLNAYDMVLCEGIRYGDHPVFEVYNSENSSELKSPVNNITAIIGDKKVYNGLPFFNRDEITVIADYLESFIKRSV